MIKSLPLPSLSLLVFTLPVVIPTVVLSGMSFPAPDLPLLAWIALIPWLILIGSAEPTVSQKVSLPDTPEEPNKDVKPPISIGFVALTSWLIGITFFTIKLSWLGYATNVGWILLSFYLSLYFLIFGVACFYIQTNLKQPLALVAPFIWVSLEYVRGFLLTGFPWFYLGHTQYSYLPIIQIADITGVYGVSFAIVMANACFAQGFIRWWMGKSGHFLFAIAFVLLLFPLSYGVFRLAGLSYLEGPRLCMVQGNIHQDLKMDPNPEQRKKNFQKYLEMSREIKPASVDMVVWPETAAPGLVNLHPRLCLDIDRFVQSSLSELANELQTYLLVGGVAIELGNTFRDSTFHNSAFLYGPDGKLLDRYDKLHLVPFGEYTPLRGIFPFLRYMVPYEIDFSPGKRWELLELKGKELGTFKFATLICYEDTIPTLARHFVKNGANFLINITNDGWFCDSPELDQHLAIMVFRAVENRVGVARAANTGISAFVAPTGDIYSLVTKDGKKREVDGVLQGTVLIAQGGPSFYTKYGDLFSQLCLVVSLGSLLTPTVRKYLPNR